MMGHECSTGGRSCEGILVTKTNRGLAIIGFLLDVQQSLSPASLASVTDYGFI